jgi:hypothetical protein
MMFVVDPRPAKISESKTNCSKMKIDGYAHAPFKKNDTCGIWVVLPQPVNV